MENPIRYNNLVLIEVLGTVKNERKWLMKCDCGTIKIVSAPSVKRGHTKSCGCRHKERNKGPKYQYHGMCKSTTYRSWNSMKTRCKSQDRQYYFGKGITYCERWEKFENFLADMGERPEGMTLDRINPNGNYEPSNCKWSTHKEQGNNRTNNIKYECYGKSLSLNQWAEISGFTYALIQNRLRLGWDIKKALETPIDTSKHRKTPRQ